jgi:hypothetical protein
MGTHINIVNELETKELDQIIWKNLNEF